MGEKGKNKEQSKTYSVQYSLPTSLGVPFNTCEKGVEVFKYQIKIEGNHLDLTVYTPNFVGNLFQMRQNLPYTDKTTELKISLQKVEPKFIEKKDLRQEQFKNMIEMNQRLWKMIIPQYETKFKFVGLDSQNQISDLEKNGTKSLLRQYLVDSPRLQELFGQPSSPESFKSVFQSNGQNIDQLKDNIFRVKHNKKKMVFVRGYFSVGEKDSVYQFSKKLLAFGKKIPKAHLSEYTETGFFKTEFSEDLKKGNKNLMDFLDGEGKSTDRKPIVSALEKMKSDFKLEKQPITEFCLVIEAEDQNNYDHNYVEGIEKYQTNKKIEELGQSKSKMMFVPVDKLEALNLKSQDLDSFNRITPSLIQLERMAQVRELKLLFNCEYMKDHLIFKALNSKAIDKFNNYETLETVGDAVLKTLITKILFLEYPKKRESDLTVKKVALINNSYLAKKAHNTPLPFFLKDKYLKTVQYVPPFHSPLESGELAEKQIFSEGMLADCVEALLGVAFLSSRRFYEPFKLLEKFQIVSKADFSKHQNWLLFQFPKSFSFTDQMQDEACFNEKSSFHQVYSASLNPDFSTLNYRLEKKLELALENWFDGERKEMAENESKKKENKELRNEEDTSKIPDPLSKPQPYNNHWDDLNTFCEHLRSEGNFSEKQINSLKQMKSAHLLQEFQTVHLGYEFEDRATLYSCLRKGGQYERLEYLGDAVIESMALYMARKVCVRLKISCFPELLHSVKVIVLSNRALGSLLIFHGLHKYLILDEQMAEYQKIVKFIKTKTFDRPFRESFSTELEYFPKFLGDTLEALFGAIFYDGGWKPLLKFFERIAFPLIYFLCVYFDSTTVDMRHDLESVYQKKGLKLEFETTSTKKENSGLMYETRIFYHTKGKRIEEVKGKAPNSKEASEKVAIFNLWKKKLDQAQARAKDNQEEE